MSTPSSFFPGKADIGGLSQAVAASTAYDRLQLALNPANWQFLADHLQPMAAPVGQVLIEQGATDRVVYLVEEGVLSAHLQDEQGRMRLAVINPGTMVGEGAFFSGLPRSASVVVTSAARLWCLTPPRFADLAQRQPALALELTMAFAAVTVRRLNHTTRRIAIT